MGLLRCIQTFSNSGITVAFLGVEGSTYNYLVTNSPSSGRNLDYLIFNIPCSEIQNCSITPMNTDVCQSGSAEICEQVIEGPIFFFDTPFRPGDVRTLSFTLSQTLPIGNILLGINTNQSTLCGSICGPLCP